MSENSLVKYLETEGYFNIRELPDGIVCCIKMIFTVAVIIDATRWGYDGRYCYATEQEAIACCNSLTSIDDAPLPGYKAIK